MIQSVAMDLNHITPKVGIKIEDCLGFNDLFGDIIINVGSQQSIIEIFNKIFNKLKSLCISLRGE
jgi:hypothetical protein